MTDYSYRVSRQRRGHMAGERRRAATAGDSVRLDDAVRSCLYAVVDRFNTEDPFWSSFVPDPDKTRIESGGFSVTLRGLGVDLEVVGVLAESASAPRGIIPSIVVGGKAPAMRSPLSWHPVTCTVDGDGRFVTSNFRKAIEASIDDVREGVRR
jgi:hypothetical protein